MYKAFLAKLVQLHQQQVPATGIGLFRILYGLVTLQEILFLLFFNHLIFDPVPFIDVEFPMIPFFLCAWAVIASFVTVGYRYNFAIISNYIIWIVFVNFTPMQRDFDGGFDLFMIGAGFFLLFMPGDRALSIDNLRRKLSLPFTHYSQYPAQTVSRLAYILPVAICLGFLYFDSAIHKMFAEHWRNGLGCWLPATQPYYVSALDMSPFLNNEIFEKTFGYAILIFQFTFIFFFTKRNLRIIYLLLGMSLHLGITLSFNIYPFGLGMLSFYALLVPFKYWRAFGSAISAKQPALTIFYDKLCPLCNRTVLTLNHFDIFSRLDFKNAQEYAQQYPALKAIDQKTLLTDLYALDRNDQVYSGVGTYIEIFKAMGYLYPIGLVMSLPGIKTFAESKYRAIADARQRVPCTESCSVPQKQEDTTLYHKVFEQFSSQKPKAFATKLSKVLIVLFILQLNSSIHYGIIYRLKMPTKQNPITNVISQASNSLLLLSGSFLGITPHALYLHDHFTGYDRILAITYTDKNGMEQWLPFINEQGRILAPNWGRVHSMWANIAVTPNIDNRRLKKFIMKVTAFWGTKIGLDINQTQFQIKLKRIEAPSYWVEDLLHKNMSAPWTTIGTVNWTNNTIDYQLPEDINSL